MINQQMPGQPGQNPATYHQPGNKDMVSTGPQEWKNGLFGCLSDIPTCLMSWCCPCVQYGKNYEAINKSGCASQGCAFLCLAYIGCSCLIHKDLRHSIRTKYNLPEAPCGDCLTTCCCPVCALCQEAREIKDREIEKAVNINI